MDNAHRTIYQYKELIINSVPGRQVNRPFCPISMKSSPTLTPQLLLDYWVNLQQYIPEGCSCRRRRGGSAGEGWPGWLWGSVPPPSAHGVLGGSHCTLLQTKQNNITCYSQEIKKARRAAIPFILVEEGEEKPRLDVYIQDKEWRMLLSMESRSVMVWTAGCWICSTVLS